MATYPVSPPSIYKAVNGAMGYLAYLPPDNNGFNAGALVYQNGSQASECGTNPTAILGIAGIGSNDRWVATYGKGAEFSLTVPINIIYDDTIVEMTLLGTLASTDIGASFGLTKDTNTGYWCVNKNDTTNTRVMVIGLPDTYQTKFAVGDTNPRVLVKFLANYLQASK